jgi:hypothetical protein
MVIASGTTLKILFKRLLPDNLGAACALEPKAFGANAALLIIRGLCTRLLPREPRHGEHYSP